MSKMKGRLMTDHLAGVANTATPSSVKTTKDIECSALVHVNQALLRYGDGKNLHRPYLYITGVVNQLVGEFPCGVDTMELGTPNSLDDMGPRVSFQIEFSQSELATLCEKGLFLPGFECPDIFIDNDFELPVKCDCIYLEAEAKDDSPLLFISIQNQHAICMSAADTGYDLVGYFDKMETEEIVQKQDEQLETVVVKQGDDKYLFNNVSEVQQQIEETEEDYDDFDDIEEEQEENPLDKAFNNIIADVDEKVERVKEKKNKRKPSKNTKKKSSRETVTQSTVRSVPADVENIEKASKTEQEEYGENDFI